MELEEFRELLEEYGVRSDESGQSLAVEFCPACERSKYKVLFRILDVDEDQPLFGRCQSGSCLQNYSSISYLLRLGVPRDEVFQIHDMDPYQSLQNLANPGLGQFIQESESVKAPEIKQEKIDISSFIDCESSKSPAAEWAVKRGYIPALKDLIRLDTKSSAVVFICRDVSGTVVGYQKRFLKPPMKGQKTKNVEGFRSHNNVIRFENTGDIVICEGPFTAVSAWHWGFDAITTFGSGISNMQLEMIDKIRENTNKKIIVAEENDQAGKLYYEKIANYFNWKKITVEVILPDIGNDLNDSWQDGKSYTRQEGSLCNPALPSTSTLW